MNLQDFKNKYALTLHTDGNENYVKLPVQNLEELALLQNSLLDNILYLTQVQDMMSNEQLKNSIYWLCKILMASYPQDELEGISEWLNQE